jgi:hypothetical protein
LFWFGVAIGNQQSNDDHYHRHRKDEEIAIDWLID